MIQGVLALLKSLALALGWAKQAADQKTGAQVAAGEANKEVLDEAQAIADARNRIDNLLRVREQSERSDP